MNHTFNNSAKTLYLILFIFILFFSCTSDDTPTDPDENVSHEVTLQIYYTNDEHGWLESTDTHNGAAGMMTQWKTEHGYTEDGINLVLSGGDMWTGPAITTWFRGEPMVDIMNAMDYDASAIGNHEFDFSQEGLSENLNKSDFPYLAANLKNTSGGYPSFIKPYIIKNIGGIKIGIIGLTTNSVININFPKNVQGLELIPYKDALDEAVPAAQAEGAELLVLITHIPSANISAILPSVTKYAIAFVGCGHSHQLTEENNPGYVLFETGSNLTNYGLAEIVYDTMANSVMQTSGHLYENTGSYSPDEEIQNYVSAWQSAMTDELSEVIGYTERGIARNSHEMYNLITNSWLYMFTDADISMSNYGGVRQAIPAGDISIATIVGVLPFDNNIVQVEFTGYEVKQSLNTGLLFAGGVDVSDDYKLRDGSTLDDNTTYKVLMTDYIYSVVDEFAQFDPTSEATGTNWRQPVVEWIRSLNTSSSNPIENYLDSTERMNLSNRVYMY